MSSWWRLLQELESSLRDSCMDPPTDGCSQLCACSEDGRESTGGPESTKGKAGEAEGNGEEGLEGLRDAVADHSFERVREILRVLSPELLAALVMAFEGTELADAAYTTLFRGFETAVHNAAVRELRRQGLHGLARADAPAVANAAMFAFWYKGLRKRLYDPTRSLSAYLMKIVAREASNHRRSLQDRQEPLGNHDPPAPQPSGPQRLLDREKRAELLNDLRNLSPRVRKLLRLRYLKGFKPQAIAQALGIEVALIYRRLDRARRLFKEQRCKRQVGE